MSWWRRKSGATGEGESHPDPTVEAKDLQTLTRIARTYLAPDHAERWLRLLRPAIRLIASDAVEAPLARIGGRPLVPQDFEWPVWEGSGPLSYVGEVDLDVLAGSSLDPGLDLPTAGRLLAFYFDGSHDNFTSVVGTWDRDSLAGAQLIHITQPRAESVEASVPGGVLAYPEQSLQGRQVMTHPGWEHHVLRREFGEPEWDFQTWRKHPVQAEAFNEALSALDEGAVPRHQIGGWADPVQGPVELEVAQAALSRPFEYGDAVHVAQALAWRPLLQVDSDDNSQMMWGDVGMLYWLRRDSGAVAPEMGPVSFTWQCG